MNSRLIQKPASKPAVLFATTLCAFITPITISSVNIALPAISADLNADNIITSWFVTSYILVTALLLIPFGRLGDIYGREKIFKYGVLIYGISGFLCAISYSASTLIFSRIIQGVGAAMMWGTGLAILMSVYKDGEKGKALGINVAAVYLGLSIGPLFGGFCTHYIHWRSIFIIIGVSGILLTIISVLKLSYQPINLSDEKFDCIGLLLYCFAIVPAFIGFSMLPESIGIIAIIAGLIFGFFFVIYEYRIKYPILNIRIFINNRIFIFSNIAALINYSATFAVGFLLSLYLQYIKGFDAQKAGIILIAQPIMQFAVSPFAGRISDKIEPYYIASSGMFLTAVGLGMLALISPNSNLVFIISCLILLGIGFGFFSAPNTNAVMNSIAPKHYGVASGTLATMRMLGQMLSMGIVLILFALIMGKIKISVKYYPLFLVCIQRAFLVFTFLCVIGVFASIIRGERARGKIDVD